MTKLSPQSQAVKDAVIALYSDQQQIRDWGWRLDAPTVAAALRAAADQVVPETTTSWNSTLTPMISAGEVRAKFLAIAAELEGVTSR
jgi:hypothetical protein